jgi:hypothetical protein
MAKQMSVMMFGKYKGMGIEQVPTDYLLWVFGSFPKLRNKLRGVLSGRGLSPEDIEQRSKQYRVLGKSPKSLEKRRKRPKWKRLTRTEEQLRANNVARAMGMEIPYPKYLVPAELKYFTKLG